jgi:hypothetical protein
MREMSSATPFLVTFDHCYFTGPELGDCAAAVLAHMLDPSASMLGQFRLEFSSFLLKNFGTGIVHIPAEKGV